MIDFARLGWGRTRSVGVAALTVALAGGLVVAGPGGPAGASSQGQDGAGTGARAVASGEVGRNPAGIRGYWTQGRMRAARPADLLVGGGPSAAQRVAASARLQVATSGRSVTVDGTAGRQGSSRAGVQPLSTRVPTPYRALPARTNGKVFFTEGGWDYVCSGTAVNSLNRSVVWTAGHCVNDGSGTFHRNWSFVPAYSSGLAPYGRWVAGKLLTTRGWASSGNFSVDVGAAVVRPRNGVRLVNLVGGQGIGFNRPTTGTYSSFGYPAAAPFDGSRQWRCDSTLRLRDQGSPRPLAISCNMTGGSSGGGWLRAISNGLGQVVSVNSYGYWDMPNYMFGPYQGDAALALWNRATDYPL